MAILSEAYSHADFKTRVRVTHDFLVEILSYAALHAEELRRLDREADRQTTLEAAGQKPRPKLAAACRLGHRGPGPVGPHGPRSDPAPGTPRPPPALALT